MMGALRTAVFISVAVCTAVAVHPISLLKVQQEPVTIHRIVFQRGGSYWSALSDGTQQTKFTDGRDVEVSPDGTQVVYTRPGTLPQRHIVVINLASGEELVLDAIPSDNSYGARWSPDGTMLLFHMWHPEYIWVAGIINSDNSSFKIIGHDPEDPIRFGGSAFCWGRDGTSIIYRDFEEVREYSFDGDLLHRYSFSLVDSDSVSVGSGNRLSLSPDGSTLLLEVYDGPPSSPISIELIAFLDMATGEVHRASPRNMIAYHPSWFPDSRTYVFSGCDIGNGVRERGLHVAECDTFNIYRYNLESGVLELLIRDGSQPSVGGTR